MWQKKKKQKKQTKLNVWRKTYFDAKQNFELDAKTILNQNDIKRKKKQK